MKIKGSLPSVIIAAIACVLSLVGFIGYTMSETIPGYTMGAGVFVGVIVFALCVGYTVSVVMLGENNIVSVILGAIAIVASIVLMGVVINGRINNIAGCFSYDASNPVAWKSVYTAAVAIVGLLLSSIAMIVAGFVGKKK